jgi:hypothetical protein
MGESEKVQVCVVLEEKFGKEVRRNSKSTATRDSTISRDRGRDCDRVRSAFLPLLAGS